MNGHVETQVPPVNQELPSDIKVDADGKIFLKYLMEDGFSAPIIQQYEKLITSALPQIIAMQYIKIPGGALRFTGELQFMAPDMTPHACLEQGRTYGSEMYAGVGFLPDGGGPNDLRVFPNTVFIGRLPICIGSSLSHQHNKSETELLMQGDNPYDFGGYFIVKGTEKLLLLQEKMRGNRIFSWIADKKPGTKAGMKGRLTTRMTCITLTGSQLVLVKEGKIGNLRLTLPFLRKNIKNELRSVGVMQIFRMLGLLMDEISGEVHYSDYNTIIDTIINFSSVSTRKPPVQGEGKFQDEFNRDVRRILLALNPSIVKALQEQPGGDDYEYIGKKIGVANLPYEMKKSHVIESLLRELFPQIDPKEPGVGPVKKKYDMLAMMVARTAEVLAGIRLPDDRDSWSNKRLDSAAIYMQQLFNGLWNSAISKASDAVNNIKNVTPETAVTRLNIADTITDGFETAFTAQEWGIKGSYYKENVTDFLKRDNLLSAHSHMRRVNVPTSRKAKQAKIRKVQQSQLAFVCPAETPEGAACSATYTPILTADGTWKQMGDLKNGDVIITVDPITLEQTPSEIYDHFVKSSEEYGKKVYEVTSFSGRKITVTGDHPFLTYQHGWVNADQLDVAKHHIIVYPGVSPVPSSAPHSLIFDETIFTTILKEAGVKSSIIDKHWEDLVKLGYASLYTDHSKLQVLARVCGFCLADGHLGIGKDGNVRSSFCFGTKEDVALFEEDIRLLGFSPSTPKYQESTIVDKNTGRETCHHAYTTNHGACFASLLIALGLTYGRKTMNPTKPVPDWVMNGSQLVKREFLAGFQGGDGGKIIASKRPDKPRAYCFRISRTRLHKCPTHVESLVFFMNQMKTLFEEFNIDILKVETTDDPSYEDEEIDWSNPDSTEDEPVMKETAHMVVALTPSCAEENLINYMDVIGYRYATTKNTESHRITEYLRYKQFKIKEREEFKKTVLELYGSGMKQSDIARKLGVKLRQVGSVVEYGMGNRSLAPRDTVTFEQWLENTGWGNNCIAMPLAFVKEAAPCMVGDFTTKSSNHSMISGSFCTHNCGLVKNLSTYAYISVERDEAPVRRVLISYLRSQRDAPDFINPCLLNGKIMGWCNGPQLHDFLRVQKRTGVLYRDTAIVLDYDGVLNVNCDASRLLRPALVVGDGKTPLIHDDGTSTPSEPYRLILDQLKLDPATVSWDTLLRRGCVEYIDAYEQEFTKIAQYRRDVNQRIVNIDAANKDIESAQDELDRVMAGETVTNTVDNADGTKRTITITLDDSRARLKQATEHLKDLLKARPYTHAEVDPSGIISVALSVMPMPEHDQGPRLSFCSNMMRQAIGITHPHHMSRFETTMKILAFPERPIFATQTEKILGLEKMPAGQNIILMIAPRKGYNQEDAFVFSKTAIENGLFRMIKYIGKRTTIKTKSAKNFTEILERPEIRKGEPEDRYANIGENGLPIVGAVLKKGDCVIGKVRFNNQTKVKENVSVYVGLSEDGVVDRVIRSKNDEGDETIKVKIRRVRIPEPGDKYATRSAQKGTIGLIEPRHTLPWIAAGPNIGVTPDVITNPLSMPSRMTINLLIEIATSKNATYTGERVNATAFREFSAEDLRDEMAAHGFMHLGYERMRSGDSGKMMEGDIFIGVAHKQMLRHQVRDKIQMRSTGPVSQLTRQPVGGRIRIGGQRVGNMETDSFIAHAASAMLRERLCDVSDAYNIVYCVKCGTMAIVDVESKTVSCRLCETKDPKDFVTVTIPYVYKLLVQLLWGAGFNMKLGLKKVTI